MKWSITYIIVPFSATQSHVSILYTDSETNSEFTSSQSAGITHGSGANLILTVDHSESGLCSIFVYSRLLEIL